MERLERSGRFGSDDHARPDDRARPNDQVRPDDQARRGDRARRGDQAPPDRQARLDGASRPEQRSRREVLLDAAVEMTGEAGLKGLTHRAVDTKAGLPPGSTSYYFRGRRELVEAALAHLATIDTAAAAGRGRTPPTADRDRTRPAGARDRSELHAGTAPPGGTPAREALLDLAAELVRRSLGPGRAALLARYELSLYAARDPQLQPVLIRWRDTFVDGARPLVAAAGSPDPDRDARLFVAALDGFLFDRAIRSAEPPALAETRDALDALLAGVLPKR